jgi:lysophospholipase L1-like esterase
MPNYRDNEELHLALRKQQDGSRALEIRDAEGNSISRTTLGAQSDSPTFTGDPNAPTASQGDDDLSIATTHFVKRAIDAQHVVDNGTYVRQAQAIPTSRKVVYAGDSITAGTGASTGPKAYVNLVHFIAGTRYISESYATAGVAGNTSAQLLARFDAILATASIGIVHVQIGTNDAGGAVPVATYAANIQAMYAKARAANVAMTIGLVPPRSSTNGTTSTRQFERGYNEWITTWAPTVGVPIADTRGPLIDSTTGYLAAANDTGDGVHPSDTGHWLVATAVASALRKLFPTIPSLPVLDPNVNLSSNGIMAGGGTIPTGYYEQPGGTGTAPTYSIVADASGTLDYGSWWQMDFDATASGGTRKMGSPAVTKSGNWATGDTLQAEAKVQIEDVSGLKAALLAGTATVSLLVVNSSGTTVATTLNNTATAATGPICFRFPGPAVGTSVFFWLVVTLPTGVHAKVRFGEAVIRNLTAEGAPARP